MNPEIIDNINKPSHYQGAKCLAHCMCANIINAKFFSCFMYDLIGSLTDVVHNFVGNLFGASAFFWGNAIKYMLRFSKELGITEQTVRFYGTKTSRNRYPILGLRSKKGNKSQ
ncbi:hypothetical protein RQ627_01175 [Streptococcus pneumoniae]|nr:hypothetical protein [Streptococcus pneumoniae]